MPDRCCSSPHVTLERRRSDFETDGRITPFTGSCCCCCCCLHWITAAAGGIVGLRMGWNAAERAAGSLPHPVVKRMLDGSVVLGFFVTLALSAVLTGVSGGSFLILIALVPSVVFVPLGLTMVVSAHRLKWRMTAAFQREVKALPPAEGRSMSLYRRKEQAALKTRDELLDFHVFCRHCWYDLGESMHLTACPECHEPIQRPHLSGPDYGTGIAWRAALTSVGVSTGATIAGYVLMYLIALVIK